MNKERIRETSKTALSNYIKEPDEHGLRCLWAIKDRVVFLGLQQWHNQADFREALEVADGQQRSQWGYVKVEKGSNGWIIIAPRNTRQVDVFQEEMGKIIKMINLKKRTFAFKDEHMIGGVPPMELVSWDREHDNQVAPPMVIMQRHVDPGE